MDNDQLRTLFSSLSELAQLGPIPVQAYSMMAQQHTPEALAEHLHQRWMADGRFAAIAANIVLHIHKTDAKGMGLSSCVLALLLNDYRNRLAVRSHSSLMFRNLVKALFAMYPVYVEMDACVSKCLIKPMFNCLDVLIDVDPDVSDIETMAVIMSEHGSQLHELNSYFVDRLVVKIREQLCSDAPDLRKDVRRMLLHVVDLWSFGWNELMIPEALTANYSERSLFQEPVHRKEDIKQKDFGSKESIV